MYKLNELNELIVNTELEEKYKKNLNLASQHIPTVNFNLNHKKLNFIPPIIERI